MSASTCESVAKPLFFLFMQFHSSVSRSIRAAKACRFLGALACLGLVVVGCDVPSRPPFAGPALEQPSKVQSPAVSIADSVLTSEGLNPSTDTEDIVESWKNAIQWRAGIKPASVAKDQPYVGEYRFNVEKITDQFDGKTSFKVTSIRRLWVDTGSLRVLDQFRIDETQNEKGELVNFVVESRQGPSVRRVRGSVEADSLVSEIVAGRPENRQVSKWTSQDRGFFAAEAILNGRNVKPGDSFPAIRALVANPYGIPIVGSPTSILIQCTGQNAVYASGKYRKLPEVVVSHYESNELVARSVRYMDNEGWPLRMVDHQGFVVLKTKDDTDLKLPREPDAGAEVTLKGKSWDADAKKFIEFRMQPLQGNSWPVSAFAASSGADFSTIPAAPRQSVLKKDAEVMVRLHRTFGEAIPDGYVDRIPSPLETDTRATPVCDHGHPAVRKIIYAGTRGIAPDEKTAIIRSLFETSRSMIVVRPGVDGVEAASKVAVNLSSDSIGQTVLLSSMLRSVSVPTRFATGIRIKNGRASFHAWPIIWDEGRWKNLDSLEGDEAKLDRIAFAIVDYQLVPMLDAIDHTLQTLAQIEIEVTECR
jgi:Transglutaminase-like superfamily